MSTKPVSTPAQDEDVDEPTTLPPGNWSQFADKISQGIAEGLAKLQPRKVTFGEYQRKLPKKPTLLRPFAQNGFPVMANQLEAEQIDMLNKLHRSGRYIGRRLEIIIRNADREIADQSVEMRYSNKTNEQRIDNAKYLGSLTDMLTKVLTEQDALDMQELDRQTRPVSRVA